jgi:hypothetical protein
LTAARWASDLRRVRRVEERQDHGVRFAIRAMPQGWLDPILIAARSQGVTLNDVFMAGIAQVCDRFVPLKHRPRRHSLALGSIVDLRPYYGDGLADAFGLFLGFTNVVCRPQELADMHRLVRSIASQNRQQKRLGVPQASALRMLAGVMAGRMMSPEKMLKFYQKHVPLAGGISNVNMNRSWATEYHPRPLLDYVRVSPTGPMMPLVFATTTLGKSFHFALTYRPSVVDPSQLDGVAKTFVDCVGSLRRSLSRA